MTLISDLIAAALARLVGLAALLAAAHRVLDGVLPALLGVSSDPPVAVLGAVMATALLLAASVAFLIPAVARVQLRRRESAMGRALAGSTLVALVVFLLISGAQALGAFGLAGAGAAPVLLGVTGAVAVGFVWHYVLPGGHAARLAARATVDAGPDGAPDPGRGLPDLLNPTIYLFLAAMGFGFAGLYGFTEAQFLPYEVYHRSATDNRWTVVIAGTAALTLSCVLLPTRNMRRRGQGVVLRALVGAAAGGLLTGALTVGALATGLPGLVSLMHAGRPDVLRVTIVAVGPEHRRRACDRVLYARLPEGYVPGPQQICDVPGSIWRTAQLGQTLILTGALYPWGFRYEGISR